MIGSTTDRFWWVWFVWFGQDAGSRARLGWYKLVGVELKSVGYRGFKLLKTTQ